MKSKLSNIYRFMTSRVHHHNRTVRAILTGLLMLSFSASTMAGWQVQWIDKFDGTGINWDNWTAQTQANYNNEVQCYTDDDSSANKNYDVSNGTLKIIARKQNIACPGLGGTPKSWTSGRLNSKDKSEFLYGRIESRIRFNTLAAGTWPAFWMLENRIQEQPYKNDNDFSHWPSAGAGEIDIWEWFSNEPDTYITNFFNSESCAGEIRYSYPNGGADVQNWHNYALEWSKDNTSFFIDNILVAQQDMRSCNQYEEPMFVLLNVAMGGNLGGNIAANLQSATMEVDYVAHCAVSSTNNATDCNEQTPSIFANDTDADGIDDSKDLCPNTVAGAGVSDNGCAAEQTAGNILAVSISINQNGRNISEINPENGLVTITALPSSNNDFYLNWSADSLPSTTQNGLTLTFDPASMSDGAYVVTAVLTDYSDPTLSASDELIFTVKTTIDQVEVSQDVSKSAGSMNATFLLCLVLLVLFRRQRIY